MKIEQHPIVARLKALLHSNTPFVAFKKPENEKVYLYSGKNKELHTVNFNSNNNHHVNGFVFVPFDAEKQAIFFPANEFDVAEFPFIPSEGIKTHNQSLSEEKKNKLSYVQKVEKAVEAIRNDMFSKVVLSRTIEVDTHESAEVLFYRLLNTYPDAFVYLWFHPKIGLWLGATPETLVTVNSNRIKTMSLAGTQPYMGSLEVTWGAKELEEQHLVTQYIVSKLVESGCQNIQIAPTQTVKAGKLLHLKNDIVAEVNATSLINLIGNLHPTPAVCGFPADASKAFINQNEGYDREFYTGFLGLLNSEANEAELFVNLRCMQLKGNKALLYVGGGITKGSVPENEWTETQNKAQTMLNVLLK